MTPVLASALMPLMRWMDPERAHELALRALRLGLAGRDSTPPHRSIQQQRPPVVVHGLQLRLEVRQLI